MFYPSMRSLMEAAAPPDREHWETVEVFGIPTMVGWRASKDRLNRAAHDGLGLRDGIPVISSPLHKEVIQQELSEERYVAIGPGNDGRILVVATEWLEPDDYVQIPAIRIISVRFAEAPEIRSYQGGNVNEDQQPQMQPKPIDPDNPPLRPDAKLAPGRQQFLKRVAVFKAKQAARQTTQERTPVK